MKFKILALVLALAFVGCATDQTSNKPIRSITPSKMDPTRAQSNRVNGPSAFNRDNCRDVVSCKDMADDYYSNGDFPSAIQAYDTNCVKFMHIPSCVKAASMFEKGEGVQANLNTAFLMFRSACYHGDKEGCKGRDRISQKLK